MTKFFQNFHLAMTILGYVVFFGGIGWAIMTHRRRAKVRHEKREEATSVKEMDFLGAEAGVRPFSAD